MKRINVFRSLVIWMLLLVIWMLLLVDVCLTQEKDVWFKIENRCYLINTTQLTYKDAVKFCQQSRGGAYLAQIPEDDNSLIGEKLHEFKLDSAIFGMKYFQKEKLFSYAGNRFEKFPKVAVLAGVKGQAPTAPTASRKLTSCKQVTKEGEYTIYVKGDVPIKLYCQYKKTYLTLSRVNRCERVNDGPKTSMHFSGVTTYQKIRIIPETLEVVTNDLMFSTRVGYKLVEYGIGGGCKGADTNTGPFVVDLRDTLFAFDRIKTVYQADGVRPKYSVTMSENDQKIDGLCGGACGWCALKAGMHLKIISGVTGEQPQSNSAPNSLPREGPSIGGECGVISGDYTWNMISCTELKPFICEKEGLHNVLEISGEACDGWLPFGDKLMRFHPKKVDYETASNTCVKNNGRLAEIRSEEENTFVQGLSAYMPAYIGYRRVMQGSNVKNWNDEKPFVWGNLAEVVPPSDKHCLSVNTESRWAMVNCDEKKPFICSKTEANVFEQKTKSNADVKVSDSEEIPSYINFY